MPRQTFGAVERVNAGGAVSRRPAMEGKVISGIDEEPIRAAHHSILRDEEIVSPFHMWSDENGYFTLAWLSPGR